MKKKSARGTTPIVYLDVCLKLLRHIQLPKSTSPNFLVSESQVHHDVLKNSVFWGCYTMQYFTFTQNIKESCYNDDTYVTPTMKRLCLL